MKTTNKLMKTSLSGLVIAFFVFLTSCEVKDKFDLTGNDSQNVENEAATDAYFEDADDMSSLSVSADPSTAGGRVEGIKPDDSRFACATVTIELAVGSTFSDPHGTITIDFGTGCTDPEGNVRKGKIQVEFIGRRFLPGSQTITTFIGYEINGIKLEGTRTVTNISTSTESNPIFKIEAEGKATWPDGTFALRTVHRTREWKRATTPGLDQWIVSQTAGAPNAAAGTNRHGRVYEMKITKPLVYKRECALSNKVFMAVEGTKELVTESRKITIDYGTGACDKIVTITINGKSKEVEVRGDGI